LRDFDVKDTKLVLVVFGAVAILEIALELLEAVVAAAGGWAFEGYKF
jgi:hypothetical protein